LNPISTGELTIGQLADAVLKVIGLRCTPAMIYNYEKLGLLPPPRRSEGGVRKFPREAIAQVVQIKRMQVEGFSLDMIKARLEIGDLPPEVIPPIDVPNDRKVDILNAAATIFPQKGYLETTLNDIAREAGVAVSTVYQHFRSKEELFLDLADSINFIHSMENINSALEGRNDICDYNGLRETMIRVANAFLFAPLMNVEIIRLFITEVKRFPTIGKIYRERLMAPGEVRLGEFLKLQMERGIFHSVEPRLAASAFYGMFLNTIISEYLFMDRDMEYMPSPEGVAAMVEIFLRGMMIDKNLSE
jgi:TetR/AcrR family transcriptional regulator, mexJK operon transcriptional repressor